jgi:hypothetical protein
MPRRSSWNEDRRAEEKYYEYLYSECRCDGEEPLCHLCHWETERAQQLEEDLRVYMAQKEAEQKAREEACPNRQWRPIIASLREKLNAVQHARGTEAKVEACRILFTELLSCEGFLSVQPKFRTVALHKIEELLADEKAESIYPLLDELKGKIQGLSGREDYIA